MNILNPDTIQQLTEQAITFVSVNGLNVLIAIAIFFIGKMIAKRLAELTRALMTTTAASRA